MKSIKCTVYFASFSTHTLDSMTFSDSLDYLQCSKIVHQIYIYNYNVEWFSCLDNNTSGQLHESIYKRFITTRQKKIVTVSWMSFFSLQRLATNKIRLSYRTELLSFLVFKIELILHCFSAHKSGRYCFAVKCSLSSLAVHIIPVQW